jgi:hypothetical protein
MRPVFEERAVLFQKRGQVFAPVGLVAGKEDLMVGALDGLDTVHLYEAEIVDEVQQAGLGQCAVRRGAQPLLGKKDAAGIGIGKKIRHGAIIARKIFLATR